MRAFLTLIGTALLLATMPLHAEAGPLRDRLKERQAARMQDELVDEGDEPIYAKLPDGVRVLRDIAYGPDPLQRFDVYAPPQAHDAPVIFMVHGGGWRHGDKRAQTVVQNKVARWVPKGVIFVSVNYRMLPQADPIEQAKDVGRALNFAQKTAAEWGGDGRKFVLMGHSAGSHLVALVASSMAPGVHFLGAVLLDSAALDVPQLMQARHLRLYDNAFGKDAAYWKAASPLHVLSRSMPPVLAVCSSRRALSCRQAADFVAKAASLGTRASVLQQDMTHKEINQLLGTAGAYTYAVDAFLSSVDPSWAALLR